MRAVVVREFGEPLQVEEVADPELRAGGVLIGVRAVGICRSDWHGWMGHDGDIKRLPQVLGHEFAGVVLEVGVEVNDVRVGDRVTAPFACGCGRCGECGSGNAQVCREQYQPGVHGAGAFAEMVAVPAADFNVVRLPEEVEFREAAALGCRFATAFRALAHADQAGVKPGETVVVFGCGGVGLSAVMVAKALGASVIGVDVRAEALEAAKRAGADRVVAADDDVEGLVREFTGGEGAEVTVDALGSGKVGRAAIGLLRPRGRHLQVGLLLGKEADPRMPMGRVIARELRIMGSHGMSAARYPEMLAMVADGRLRPGELVEKSIGMGEIPKAMGEMNSFSGSAGMTVAEFCGRILT